MAPGLNVGAIRNRRRYVFLWLSDKLLGILGFLAIVSFLFAKSSRVIGAEGGTPPEGWPAGVYNHGHYYGWWRISDRPDLFALSVVVFRMGTLPLSVFRARERKYQKAHGLLKHSEWDLRWPPVLKRFGERRMAARGKQNGSPEDGETAQASLRGTQEKGGTGDTLGGKGGQ